MQLLHYLDGILGDLREDSNTDVIYFDFSKAFDRVYHKIHLKNYPTLVYLEIHYNGSSVS